MSEETSARLVIWALLGLHAGLIACFALLSSRRIWWRNSLTSLKHPRRAGIIARLAPDGTAGFGIRPARASVRGAALFSVGALLALIAFAGSHPVAFFAALVPTGIGALLMAAGGRYRRPTRIAISAQGLEAGALKVPLDRILSFGTGQSAGPGFGATQAAVVPALAGAARVVAAPAASAPVGQLRSALLDRSHLVTVLTVGGGRVVIAGGLDGDAAGDLAQDLERSLALLRR